MKSSTSECQRILVLNKDSLTPKVEMVVELMGIPIERSFKILGADILSHEGFGT
jgi:hypothetical protein